MSLPKISIIMPCFNSALTIPESIASVLNQSFENFELIICDDDSTDNSIEKINDYVDSRIILVKNKYQKGAAGARNSALHIARGTYVAFLDSDDLWQKNKLKLQLEYMEKNNCLFSYGNYKTCDSNSNITGYMKAPKSITYGDLLHKCNIGCLTVMLHKSIIKNELFPYKNKEDYCFWLSVLKKNKIVAYNYNGNESIYRKSTNSLSSNKFKEIFNQWAILSEYKIPIIPKLYYMLTYIINGITKHYVHYK